MIQVAIPLDTAFPAPAFPPVEAFWYLPGVYDHGSSAGHRPNRASKPL